MSVVGSNYLPPSIETFSKPSVLKSYLRTSCCRSFLVTCSYLCCFFFFFSSRRRHTRCLSVWSSDVCSSDLSYRDGNVFRLANVWMLAQPYGYPSVLSSYAFDCPDGNAVGPPSDANGWTMAVTCASSLETAARGQWVCEHRDPSILRMVSFRHAVAGTSINHWWDNGANAIAFSRGDKA